MKNKRAWRARRIISLAGEHTARGRELDTPLSCMEDAVIISRQGCVDAVVPFAAFRPEPEMPLEDLGEVTLIPGTVNAHAHIQLSHLAGLTHWGSGFVPWLRSLIPLLSRPLEMTAIRESVASLVNAGTAHVGDYTGQGVLEVGECAREAALGCTLFCEWFGFNATALDEQTPWPPRFPHMAAAPEWLRRNMAPAGHALYSTHPVILQAAHAWCVRHGKPFSLHLAEFPEETEALASGSGALVDLYTGMVLPPDWSAPGLPPVALAGHWGLLGSGTLAVHCVQCSASDITLLADSGTAVCLCPRSNAALAVGRPPATALASAGALLCLGTDGLTSNTDLDVRQEALVLHREYGFSPQALIRMLTLNGAAALGVASTLGTLEPGKRCCFTILPEELAEGV